MTEVWGHRQSDFRVVLLDADEREIRVLDGVKGGSVSLSASTRLRASGSLQLEDRGEDIDWLSQRVRIDYEPIGLEGWSLGVFLLSSPKASWSDAGRSWEVELLGKLAVLDQEAIEATHAVAAGANLVESADALIRQSGETRLAVTPSAAVASSAMVWDPGTSVLTIVNELLDAAGYWAAHADGAGVIQLAPYVRPAARPTSWTFAEGARAVHLADWTRDQDLASVPNRVVLVGQGTDDKPALVSIAANEDPESSFSFQARGRWVTHTETGVEAADQATLDAKARRTLIEKSTPATSLEISHMPIQLDPNDLVEFSSQGHRARAVIQKIDWTLDPTSLVKTSLREVVDL